MQYYYIINKKIMLYMLLNVYDLSVLIFCVYKSTWKIRFFDSYSVAIGLDWVISLQGALVLKIVTCSRDFDTFTNNRYLLTKVFELL